MRRAVGCSEQKKAQWFIQQDHGFYSKDEVEGT